MVLAHGTKITGLCCIKICGYVLKKKKEKSDV
jgi:hypothetical protein